MECTFPPGSSGLVMGCVLGLRPGAASWGCVLGLRAGAASWGRRDSKTRQGAAF
jgi:hypothetical protein